LEDYFLHESAFDDLEEVEEFSETETPSPMHQPCSIHDPTTQI